MNPLTSRPILFLRGSFIALLASSISHALPPVIPGLHGKHPLDEKQRGALLMGELRCAACHEGMPNDQMKLAPTLADAGSRLTAEYMKKFIADPAATHHGTTMPNMLGAETEEKRKEIAAEITAYLCSLKGEPAEQPTGDIDPYDGKEAFHSIGCVACHSPRDEALREVVKDGVIPLTHLAGKYQPHALASFLHAPLAVRPSGRMPDMKLTKEEAAEIAAYLEGEVKPSAESPATADLIAAGKRAFTAYNCTACHQPEKNLPAHNSGPALTKIDLTRGCLSDAPEKAPNFHLSAEQKKSIRTALENSNERISPQAQVNTHLTRLNCIACHTRDDFGGVSPKLDGFFHSTEEALGNESRIPPPLTLVGAKLRPEWLKKVLYDGESIRPYMTTRMPQFGDAGLADLADLFAQVDKMDPITLAPPEQESQPQMRDGAHFLLGDGGLNCIACHNYNGKESPGMKGLDLMTSYQRLQPAWFYNYMINPAKFRPGIIMPSYWPNGKAVQTETLDGDTERQLRALWDNFSLGRSARDPSGLRSEPSMIAVTEKAHTYRGRSSVAGYRGIAVGFPGGMNYAFNANNGALTAIWSGKFIRVNWQGQGSGNFDPLERPVQLAQDVAFLLGNDAPEKWPLHPVTTKEQPVNPDPLYPRNHGYAFLGYTLDEKSDVPTFGYRCGDVEIADISHGSAKTLQRNITFNTAKDETIWFRALTGKITAESDAVYLTNELKLTIEKGTALLRPSANGEQELLIKITLPKGTSTTSIRYDWLR